MMTRHSVICDLWSVVVVPFPFIESPGAKRRPALVLSKRVFNESGHTILAMITTKDHGRWLGDMDITDVRASGLHQVCLLRLKLFTLDNRLILKRIGTLGKIDRKKAAANLHHYLG